MGETDVTVHWKVTGCALEGVVEERGRSRFTSVVTLIGMVVQAFPRLMTQPKGEQVPGGGTVGSGTTVTASCCVIVGLELSNAVTVMVPGRRAR